ncbi:hypothetical protein F4810DRAFT_77870 [Camillea tinctor]|nr:hypothetical protein F4810DRAFT_77870 [Camillea tinctor]
MAPVTEILTLTLAPDTDQPTLLSSIEETLRAWQQQHEPLLRAQHAFTHEDPLKLRLAHDWADVPASSPLSSLSSPGRGIAEARGPYHVAFDPPQPRVLDTASPGAASRVTEMVHMYFPPARRGAADVGDAVARFVAELRALDGRKIGFSGEAAWGWVAGLLEYKGEDHAVFVLCLGWQSVKAHVEFRDTEDFQRSIPIMRGIGGLKGSEMAHVSLRRVV